MKPIWRAAPTALGESCGRCLLACPADAILHWGLDKQKCAPYASPHGFSHLVSHVGNILEAESTDEKINLLRSGDSFNLWQTMLRGVGAYTGCTRCVDVCPVGADYAPRLQAVQDEIPEVTPDKLARLDAMQKARQRGASSPGYERSRRWIGTPSEGL